MRASHEMTGIPFQMDTSLFSTQIISADSGVISMHVRIEAASEWSTYGNTAKNPRPTGDPMEIILIYM